MSATNVLGLDVGEKRIGVARVNVVVKLPEPLQTLPNDKNFIKSLKKLINEYQIDTIVVGLPRNMSGQETAQTQYVRQFAKDNLSSLGLTIIFQDETLSSVTAENHINSHKKFKYDIDSTSAAIILGDFITNL